MIIVTGMHRSGTSFTCNLLHAMGADYGDDQLLLKSDVWNQRGYFENLEVLALNNRLILGKTAAVFYEQVLASHLGEKSKAVLKSILNLPSFIFPTPGKIERQSFQCLEKLDQLSEKYSETVVKDVRFCLTLGVWRKQGDPSKVLFCYRHPWEVAMSLKRRQHIPLWKGFQLWAQHVEGFFKQAQDLPGVIVNYHHFMGEEADALQEMRRLYAFLERSYDETQAREVLSSVRVSGLYHNRCSEQILPKKTERLWDKLSARHEQHKTLNPFE